VIFESRREQLAWAAGLFNGEGSIGCYRMSGNPRPNMSMGQTDRWVLDEFHCAVLRLGKVLGPYARGKYKPLFSWQTAKFETCQAVIAMLWPWLSPQKRAQATTAMLVARKRRVRRQLDPKHYRPEWYWPQFVGGGREKLNSLTPPIGVQ